MRLGGGTNHLNIRYGISNFQNKVFMKLLLKLLAHILTEECLHLTAAKRVYCDGQIQLEQRVPDGLN